MPLAIAPPRNSRFGSPLVLSRVHWVRPEMVVEVSYVEWTPDGLLRHVVYLGEREDKLVPRCAAAHLIPGRLNRGKSGPHRLVANQRRLGMPAPIATHRYPIGRRAYSRPALADVGHAGIFNRRTLSQQNLVVTDALKKEYRIKHALETAAGDGSGRTRLIKRGLRHG